LRYLKYYFNIYKKLLLHQVFHKFAKKIMETKTVDELRFDLNVKLMKFRRFRFENGSINNPNLEERAKKGFFKKIFS
jgi:hypothetical protein